MVLVSFFLLSLACTARSENENPGSGPASSDTDPKVAETLEAVRQAFGDTPESVWVSRVKRGQDEGQVEGACGLLKNFVRKAAALEKAQNTPGVEPESLPKDAETILTKLGKEVALGLLSAHKDVPYETRDGMSCGGLIADFGNGISILDAVMTVMERSRIDPHDVETSEEALRGLAFSEFQRQIIAARADKEEGRAGPFFAIAVRAAEEWRFAPEKIGLTPGEKKELHIWLKARLAGNPATVSH
jgi:hypothetical protein